MKRGGFSSNFRNDVEEDTGKRGRNTSPDPKYEMFLKGGSSVGGVGPHLLEGAQQGSGSSGLPRRAGVWQVLQSFSILNLRAVIETPGQTEVRVRLRR